MVCPSLLLIPGMHMVLRTSMHSYNRQFATTFIRVPGMALSTQLHTQCLAVYQSVSAKKGCGTDANHCTSNLHVSHRMRVLN